MKPRRTHLLLAAVTLAALGGGIAALRFLPSAEGPRGTPSAPRKIALAPATPSLEPIGGALLPGLRRAAPRTGDARAVGAPQIAQESPATRETPQPQETPPAPVATAEPPPSSVEKPELEGVVSFPPQPVAPPAPPLRPADLAKAAASTPLPQPRPTDLRDLASLAPPAAPQPPEAQAPEGAPQAAGAAPAEAPLEPRGPPAPLPPSRPRDLAALAPAPAPAPAQPPAPPAAAPTTQVARLPEPTLRPAPDDAFQQPPPKFGMGDPVYVRIFKQEGQLELWLKKNGRYALYKTFTICKWSGRLGPKIKEADYQSPEGFYSVSTRQLNPHSNYHRAFNVGYPNAFDRQNGRTGGLVMVHGACKSVGCFAMTDRGIEEIYGFVEAALRAGQREVPVHIFPFRLTESALARETGGGWLAFVGGGGNHAQWASFWKNLKQGYDLFEQTGEPPVAFACGDHYEFGGGGPSCRRVAGW